MTRKYNVNLKNYSSLSPPMSYLKIKDLEEGLIVTLIQEEINTLIEGKEIFKTLAEIINESINDVDINVLGTLNILRDNVWLSILTI